MDTKRDVARPLATAAEPTLGALLTHAARTVVPARLYQLLQLGLPLAIDFGLHGMWRAAAWGMSIAALGAWGLADRWLWQAECTAKPNGWTMRVLRVGRMAWGGVAAGTVLVLLAELFLRAMGSAPIS